jgi:hypothetical protein
MSESPRAIFLSYASQDAEAARRVCEALQQAGLEVWFDQSELRGGDAWDASIRRQIRDCALFVALISANTDARSEGYYRREWNLAVHRMLDMAEDQPFLVPVVIDDTTEAAARVPDRFRERQWTRLPGGTAPPAFVERMTRLIAGGQARRAATPASAGAAAPADPVRAHEGFGIAVLPFRYRGTDAGLAALALQRLWTDIENRYEERRHDIERPLLPPAAVYLAPQELATLAQSHARVVASRAAFGSKPSRRPGSPNSS